MGHPASSPIAPGQGANAKPAENENMDSLPNTRRIHFVEFVARHPLAVLCSAGPEGQPQAALMNIAALPDLSLAFETTDQTRKFANIARDGRVALVFGGGQETLQYEGLARRAEGREHETAREAFLAAFPAKSPDESWPGNSYFLVTPSWLRFSSYYRPRFIEEYRLARHPAPRLPGWRGRLAAWAQQNPQRI
jgi:hypothetical protein